MLPSESSQGMQERIRGLVKIRDCTQKFKNDAVRYWKEHPELGIAKCAKNLGISKTALSNWRKIYAAKEGTVP